MNETGETENTGRGSPAAPIGTVGRGADPGRGRLEGRRILIVGAGQQDYGAEEPPFGNGRALSVLCAREGARLALADIESDPVAATADLVRAEGVEPTVEIGDASEPADVERFVADAASAMGGLDGLVLNVGTGAGLGIGGTTPEDWDRVMAVNLRSAFLGCKYGLERMNDGGAIVITGSVASSQVMPIPAYGASKAALDSLCRQAAVEGAPRLRVNQVVPGLIDTSLGRLASAISPRRDQVKIPLGRQGTAWEVAAAALFLLSDDAAYVTGQQLIVDGGLTIGPRA
jgi:NAD(P)-dependent dehydrogenase (short-subunit alcohol dehydrogenase family)